MAKKKTKNDPGIVKTHSSRPFISKVRWMPVAISTQPSLAVRVSNERTDDPADEPMDTEDDGTDCDEELETQRVWRAPAPRASVSMASPTAKASRKGVTKKKR